MWMGPIAKDGGEKRSLRKQHVGDISLRDHLRGGGGGGAFFNENRLKGPCETTKVVCSHLLRGGGISEEEKTTL